MVWLAGASASWAGSTAGEPRQETLAYGVDGDEYSATMLTRREFGCVQFKAVESYKINTGNEPHFM
jgi:hypothetical protein